jgi:hypothetical protein
MKPFLTAALVVLFAGSPVLARDEAPLPPLPDADQADSIEPGADVNIRATDEGEIIEYRHDGRLYMIKVTPRGAPPYYLIDRDGNGTLESRHKGPMDPVIVPNWILFSW